MVDEDLRNLTNRAVFLKKFGRRDYQYVNSERRCTHASKSILPHEHALGRSGHVLPLGTMVHDRIHSSTF